MRQLPDTRVLLRWASLGLGFLFIFGNTFVTDHLTFVGAWAEQRFAGDQDARNMFQGMMLLALTFTSLPCFATAWGLKRNKKWSRWTGVAACVLLLAGFPCLTLMGVVGLYVLLRKPLDPGAADAATGAGIAAKANPTRDFWAARRKSKAQGWISGFLLVLVMNGTALSSIYARRVGMPEWNPGVFWWVYFFGFLLVNTLVHELGHASMAWALSDQVRAIVVGPFTFTNDRDGYSFQFEWKKLLQSSGFVSSVPASGTNLRRKFIATVVAGPAASLLNGLVFTALFFSLPGTRWQAYWGPVAFYALINFYYAVSCLIPVGYSDGSMLYHLLRWRKPGKQLINHLRVMRIHEDADELHNRADFEEEVALRQAGLQLALEDGEDSAVVIAVCYQYLGHAKLAQEDWVGAAAEFSKCLEFQAEITLHPALGANVWAGLVRACAQRHQVNAMGRIYASAAAAIEARKKDRDRLGLAVTKTMLAQIHQRAGSYEKGRQEAQEGLRILPEGRERQYLRAILSVSEALCELGLGSVEAGLGAAHHAAEILRSGKVTTNRQNLAWDELGELGEELWRLGQANTAMALLREAIEHLESAGVVATAAGYRIKLAGVLRQVGRPAEAWAVLPEDAGLPPGLLRCLLAERAELLLEDGRPHEAVTACRELAALWPGQATVEMAATEALLARAWLESGDREQAGALAQHASRILEAWKHPAAVSCRVTLALAGSPSPEDLLGDAFLAPDQLLTAAEKVRLRETESARLLLNTVQA